MIIFIDESGDAGFKTQRGSSKLFVIALVIFDNELEAEKTAEKIKNFKVKLGKQLNYEIKFNNLRKSDRSDFLEAIKDCKFRVRAIVVKKDEYLNNLRTDTKNYYNFFLKQVLEHNNETIRDAKLRLDGFNERKFKKAMESYLRQNLNGSLKNKVMSNLKFVDSKDSVLIQLVDMVAGSIRRSYQAEKHDSRIYKEIIKKRIEEEWIF
ncbi:MAG: hypothetical protein UR64_C0026G0002 [Candidatus Nomurabacteria bacterium GW2011_GWE1_35_16]|uniref:DUF3800 domain-containing protein n=1 Tax=Candidatus Nomurabacteria bacterium GW2011_GWE1_35_16 TaxID=1618761 RepID=A0A0G0B816_9BACT|nr:MAG: hypothetical protein UR64_C0026G0002 [Candidatus Nomurabacteria bacterium GW2011_GWE1_35_16]